MVSRHGAWLRIAAVTFIYSGYVASMMITSSPQLGVDTVCDNQDVTLMCHTDQTTGNMITWYWSNQSQHGDTITVVARMTGVVYTCVDSKGLHNVSITVVAYGVPPIVLRVNFSPYISINEGSNLTLITKILSDLPLSSGDIKWVGFHRPLPSTAVVDNYTTDGVLYSRLSLYELSFEDDSGNYTNIVSNQCGTSSVFGFIEVQRVPNVCNNSGTLIALQPNIMTVKGESIKLHCLFKGNLKTLGPSITSYWGITPYGQTSNKTFIMDNSTYPYLIGVYQIEDCNFTNQLTIQSVPLYHVTLTCGEKFNETTYSHNSEFTSFDIPNILSDSSKHIKAKLNETVTFKCQLQAPTTDGVTIVKWLKDNLPIQDTEHYRINTTTNPGVDDLIISDLSISAITGDDRGIYTCYCYYNRTMVTTSKLVRSNNANYVLTIEGPHSLSLKFWEGIIGSSVAAFVFTAVVSCFVLCCFIYQYRRCVKQGSGDNDECSNDDDSNSSLEPFENNEDMFLQPSVQCSDARNYRTFYENTTTPVNQLVTTVNPPPHCKSPVSQVMGSERFRMEGGQPPESSSSSSADMTMQQ